MKDMARFYQSILNGKLQEDWADVGWWAKRGVTGEFNGTMLTPLSQLWHGTGGMNESLVFSSDDIQWRLAEFYKSANGKLFITGYIGSGKSSTARDIASEVGCKHIELDNSIGVDRQHVERLRELNTEESTKELGKYFQQCIDSAIEKLFSSSEKCVVEGIQIYMYSFPERFKEHSVVVKGKSALMSYLAAYFRNIKDKDFLAGEGYFGIAKDAWHNLMIRNVEAFTKMVRGWTRE